MKCNYPKESPNCSFHYNGECLREHNYECPALAKPTDDVIRFFNKWHPYPKEKPGEQGFYLITEPVMLNSKEYRVQIYYWGKSWECEEIDPKLKKKKAYWIYSDSEWGDYECKDVVAWMPLPEPYAPKEKTDEAN